MHGALHKTGGLAWAEKGCSLAPFHQSRAKPTEGGNLQAGAETSEKYTRSPVLLGPASCKKGFVSLPHKLDNGSFVERDRGRSTTQSSRLRKYDDTLGDNAAPQRSFRVCRTRHCGGVRRLENTDYHGHGFTVYRVGIRSYRAYRQPRAWVMAQQRHRDGRN